MLKEPSLKMQALMTNKILIESIFHSILAYFEKSLISKQIRLKLEDVAGSIQRWDFLMKLYSSKRGVVFPV